MSLRVLVMLVFGVSCAGFSLWRPYVGLLALSLLYFIRPALWGAEEYVKPVQWITLGVFLGWLFQEKKEPWYRGAGWFLSLLSLYTLSCFFASYQHPETWPLLERIAKVFVATFLIVKLCDTPQRLAGFVVTILVGMLWFIKATLLLWAAQGFSGDVRIETPIGQGGGSNYVAWVLAATLPFLLYKAIKAQRWQRWGAIVLIPLWLGAIVATGSRGGFVCMGASSLVFLLLTRQIKVLLAIAAAVVLLISFVPDAYWDRISTITINPEEMDASAYSRYQHRQAALEIVQDFPLLGTGLGTFPIAKMDYVGIDYKGGATLVCHNTYLQMASEVGLPFLAIFLLLNLWIIWHLVRRTPASHQGEDWDHLEWVRVGILSGLAALAVQMAKGDEAGSDFFWWMYGIAVACVRLRQSPAKAAQGVAAADAHTGRRPAGAGATVGGR